MIVLLAVSSGFAAEPYNLNKTITSNKKTEYAMRITLFSQPDTHTFVRIPEVIEGLASLVIDKNCRYTNFGTEGLCTLVGYIPIPVKLTVVKTQEVDGFNPETAKFTKLVQKLISIEAARPEQSEWIPKNIRLSETFDTRSNATTWNLFFVDEKEETRSILPLAPK